MSAPLTRLLYVDDSGHPQSGLSVYGWIEFAPDRWASVLASWLDLRKRLWRDFGIPVMRELHTAHYVNGRGRVSERVPSRHVHEGVEFWKDFGREVALEGLRTIGSIEGLRAGAVYRAGPPDRIARTRVDSYAALITRLERELAEESEHAIVFMDGDGSDSSYRTTHRALKLAERRVIEDAIHLDSRSSQLIQMADLVAWSAHAHVSRHPASEFATCWYEDHLSQRDPDRAPRQI